MMRPRFLLIAMFCALSFPAQAEEAMNATQMCRQIAAYQDAGSAAYVPGVDVHGNAVAPADLNPSFSNALQPIVIPIEMNLLERFDIDVPLGVKMDPAVAQMTIYPDGKVEYNGQEVTQRAAFVCSEERLKARGIRSNVTIKGMKVEPEPAPPPTPEQKSTAGDGQAASDAINIKPVPVVPPQEPLWDDDEVLSGEGH